MEPDIASISPLFIIYSISLLIMGAFCFYHELKSGQLSKSPFHAPMWQGSLLELGVMLWCLFMIYLVTPNISNQLFDFLHTKFTSDTYRQVALGLSAQLVSFLFIAVILSPYPNLLGREVNNTSSHIMNAIKPGVKSFFMAIPLIWLASFVWNLIIALWGHLGLLIEIKKQTLVTLFAQSDSYAFIATIFCFAVFIAPITEEFIFRVIIYRFMKTRWNQRVALIISSLLFAIIHFNVASFLPLFLLGILLARSYEQSGHIGTPIVFHALFNLNTLILLLLQPDLSLFAK